MKTAGIITEYNPFHNGHRYQVEQLRSRTDTDTVIAVMSGDFVQRGEPAVYDKYTRTRMALHSGVDLVLELPCVFATSSAEDFAACGVALLEQLGVVNTLCFGSECGAIEPLEQIAALLAEEPEAYQILLRESLKQGNPYPKARHDAALRILSSDSGHPAAYWEEILSAPNNILGIEYIKALIRFQSQMKPFTIARSGHGYHDLNMDSDTCFASASAIRNALSANRTEILTSQLPSLPGASSIPVFPDDISHLLNYRLLTLIHAGEDLTRYLDVSRELADRITNLVLQFSTFTERIELLKTRQYTYTRISRALIHLLLDITDEQSNACKKQGYVPYARILGFRQDAAPLLHHIKSHASIPLISKTADAHKLLSEDAMNLFKHDLHSSHVYQSILHQKSGAAPRNEYTQSIIVV